MKQWYALYVFLYSYSPVGELELMARWTEASIVYV